MMRAGGPVACAVAVLLALSACGTIPGPAETDTPEPSPSPSPEATFGPVATEIPRTLVDLAHAVVQIFAMVEQGGDLLPVWTGSGTFVSADGLILTNAHVVDDRFDDYDVLGIAVTEETDQLPELRYRAEILAVDYDLDLAVVRVTTHIDGGEVTERDFAWVPLGDSNEIEIGDPLTILGYPGIGGETITLTRGVVSGFTSERTVEGRAWIKTDATIAGGNSGGLGVDSDGELIGVPTRAGTQEGNIVDCRRIQDTDGDGRITEDDSCIPIGGYINGLRPVNLAVPLIDAAAASEPYEGPGLDPPEPGFDVADVTVRNVVFSTGVSETDEPTEVVTTFPSGASSVCAFWDYEGMADGVEWDAVWFIDAELSENGSVIGDTWVGGESGTWWVCLVNEGDDLAEGVYEFLFSVTGEPLGSNAIFVGDDRPTVAFELVNDSGQEICYAFLSPTGAQYWGPDDLGLEVTVPPGSSHTLDVPAGTYDILLLDCETDTLVEEFEFRIEADTTYTLTD